jgi:glyoxylase-like metal-dependent hydrolase (beta-lactamase superfamily II)
MSRYFSLLAGAALTALVLGAAVQAQQPAAPAAKPARPTFETTKVEGTDNVYVFRYLNRQAMFVVTSAGVIATDPIGYGFPETGAAYLDAIKKVTNQPIKYVIYSHHHFDHIAGGKLFKDAGATFVAHKKVKDRLAVLKDPNTVLPDETFEKNRTIKLGGTVLELTYHGLNHSDSTIVMRLPKERIIFTVDTVPVGSVPGRGFIDSYPLEWEQFLGKLYVMDWERMIPGHPGQPGGRLGTKKDVQDLLTFMQDASEAVKAAARQGKCWDAVEKEMKLPKYESWPGYANGLQFVLRRYCGLWGRGT